MVTSNHMFNSKITSSLSLTDPPRGRRQSDGGTDMCQLASIFAANEITVFLIMCPERRRIVHATHAALPTAYTQNV